MITQPAEQQNLFSLSSQSTSSDATIAIIQPLPPPPSEPQSSAEHATFGWGDLPVLMSGFSAFTSPPLKCEKTPPPPPSFSSSKQSSSSDCSRRHHLLSDDYSSPSLALSVVSEDDDIAADDDLDQYAEWLSASSALSFSLPLGSKPQQATESISKNSNERQVRFASVTVQEHEVVLGDHPWAGAYPLALGWQHSRREYTLEDYEQERLVDGRRLRSRGELPLRLSAWERRCRLSTMAGCDSLTDLQAQESKRQHEQENQTYPMCDDEDEDDENAPRSLCYQDKVRQLPADFYTTIIVPSSNRRRSKSYGSIHFF